MKTYLFDFDGTLVDSMPTYAQVMRRILNEYGAVYTDDIFKIITPLGYGGTAEYFIEMGINETKEALVEKMQRYATEEYSYRIPEKEGVTQSLRELKKSGASLNVLTASPHTALDPCLKRLGVWELFDNVWSCEDFGTTKADTKIYEMAAEKMGLSVSEVIFVDDNVNAVKTAKAAGMISYGIYDDSSSEYIDEMREISDRYVMKFEELCRA